MASKRQIATAALVAAALGGAVGSATTIELQGDGVVYHVRLTSTPDTACLEKGLAYLDSAGKFYLPSTKETKVQLRAIPAMQDLLIAQCNKIYYAVDTVPVTDTTPSEPPDSLPSDTVVVPPDSIPTDTLPSDSLPTDTVPTPTDSVPPVVSDTQALRVVTQYIGPTKAYYEAIIAGFGLMDSTFFKWEPTVWAREGSQWAGNYYDRCMIYYVMFARTGNPLYRVRGDAICLDYRRNYLHANNYQASSHWAQLDGVALHYWLTGDDSSRIAVGKTAWNLAPTITWARTGNYTDARTHARALTGVLLAWQMNAPNAPAGGWAAKLDAGLNAILPQQSPDGAWRYPVNTCDLSLNYMGAMLADALSRVYDKYTPDPRIPVAIKKTADFLKTQWRSGDAIPSFNYYEAQCSNQHGTGGPTATPDLTGMFTSTFAWVAGQDPSYEAFARDVFRQTMRGIYPYGSKQFNQAFAFPWRGIGWIR